MAAGLFVLMSAMGLVLPTTNTQALLRTPHAAGSASALLGTSTFLVGAVLSPLVGIAGDGPRCRWPWSNWPAPFRSSLPRAVPPVAA